MADMANAVAHGAAHGDPMIWALQPGETIERTILQDRYGGRRQGGIGPSNSSPNVLIFADPAAGEPLGHFDGWRADGCFHYTGEGQRGDQQMKSGNAAILNHRRHGRALRLFMGARGRVTYVGEFELNPERPFYTTDAPEAPSGRPRSVIVFRLQPRDVSPRPSASPLDRLLTPGVERVPVEQRWTERTFVAPTGREHEDERREQALVLAYQTYLESQGHEVERLKIVPHGEAKPLFCDLYDSSENVLIEAKGTVERGAIRMAVGQLLDYRRSIDPRPQLVALLPSLPRNDLRELLYSAGVEIVWREGKKFLHTSAAAAGG